VTKHNDTRPARGGPLEHGAMWRRTGATVQLLARGLFIGSLALRLAAWHISGGQVRPEPLISFLMAGALAAAAVAVIGSQWTEPYRAHPLVSVLALVLSGAVIAVTGGSSSWYSPLLVSYTVFEALLQPAERAWGIAALAAVILALPLWYDFAPTYLLTAAAGAATCFATVRLINQTKRGLAGTRYEAHRSAAAAKAARLTTSLNLREALDGTVALACELLGPTVCIIYLLGNDTNELSAANSYFDPASYTPEQAQMISEYRLKYGSGVIGTAAALNEPLLIADASQDPRIAWITRQPQSPATLLAVPLAYGDDVLGVLRLSREGVAQYDSQDVILASILANQAAVAIANARLYESRGQAMAAARASELRYERLTNHADEAIIVVSVDNFRVSYVNEAAERILGYTLEEYQAQPGLMLSQIERAAYRDLRASLATLCAGGEVVKGLIVNWRARDGREVVFEQTLLPVRDEEDKVVAVESLCRDITERQRMETEIRRLTYHDRLTGLHNRLHFEERLAELDKAGTAPVAIILGDVNGLKVVNDAFGHLVGDELLRQAGRVMQSVLRRGDAVCRWGGDEFAAILPGLDAKQAEGVAERIRDALRQAAAEPIPLSMALGVSSRTSPDENLTDVLRCAENSMYREKLVEARSTHSAILASLQKTLRERTQETEEHAARLRDLCLWVGQRLGLSQELLTDLSLLAILHDIGKVGVPDSVLSNPGPLSEAEWEQMRQHPEIGYRIAAASPSLAPIADLILAHHERWDGAGYPRGLRGSRIPLAARILAIADAYETMINGRPYRESIAPEQALAELERCAGSQFDPKLVRVFVRTVREAERLGRPRSKLPGAGERKPGQQAGRAVAEPDSGGYLPAIAPARREASTIKQAAGNTAGDGAGAGGGTGN